MEICFNFSLTTFNLTLTELRIIWDNFVSSQNNEAMKKNEKIILTVLLILFIAAGTAISQEKKDTKKLKVIVENKEGAKVIIDTSFAGITKGDTLFSSGSRFIFVTSKDGEATWTVKDGTDLSVLSDDSMELIKEGKDGKVIVIQRGEKTGAGEGDDLMAWAITEKGSDGNVIFITENGPEHITESGKSYSIVVKKDEKSISSDKTNYVIASDGVVITIEGDNDAKVREIGKLIESQIGTDKDQGKPEPVKKTEKK